MLSTAAGGDPGVLKHVLEGQAILGTLPQQLPD